VLLVSSDCIATGGWEDDPLVFQVTGGGDIEVRVTSVECVGGSSNSKYEFEIYCTEEFGPNDPPTNNLVCDGTINPNEVLIDPNPFTSEINVEAELNGFFNGEVRLYDNMGNEVYGQDYQLDAGHVDLKIENLLNLPPTLYTLTITKDGELCKEQKLIKTN